MCWGESTWNISVPSPKFCYKPKIAPKKFWFFKNQLNKRIFNMIFQKACLDQLLRAVNWPSKLNWVSTFLSPNLVALYWNTRNEKQISKLTLRIQLSNKQEVQNENENENKWRIAPIDLREHIILAALALKFLLKLISLLLLWSKREEG